jgi:hypothetical protein
MAITIATIGRLIKNFDIAQCSSAERLIRLGMAEIPCLWCSRLLAADTPGRGPRQSPNMAPILSPGCIAGTSDCSNGIQPRHHRFLEAVLRQSELP